MIPTWVEESVFDLSDGDSVGNNGEELLPAELVVQCIPKCPVDVYLDENRNVHCKVSYNITDIFTRDKIEIQICPGTQVELYVSTLYLRTYQNVILRGKGVPRTNVNDVFDVSKFSNIVLHVYLNI